MHIGVFGAAGFLGAWTTRALLAAGHRVTAVTRPSTDLWRLDGLPGLVVMRRTSDDWSTVIREQAFETIVSLEWEGVAATTRNDAIQWSNVDRQRRMFDAAAQAGTARFVALGSQAEYGPRADRTDETVPTAPTSTYGRAKVAALDQLHELSDANGLEWVWARVFSVYGPLDNAGTLLASAADKLRADRDIELSSGEQFWSYLFASDAGSALSTLVTDRRANGIYNVGHPSAPPLRSLVEEFATHFDTDGHLNFAPPVADASALTHLQPAVERLSALGWRPVVSIPDGLAITARWLSGEPVSDPFFAGRTVPAAPAAR